MKTLIPLLFLAVVVVGCNVPEVTAQDTGVAAAQEAASDTTGQGVTLRKFIVERTIPGLGQMSREQLSAITTASNAVLDGMKAPYHWVQSFVTGDRMYCIHIAPDEETVREHARRGGFPADRVVEVTGTIDPTTTRVPDP